MTGMKFFKHAILSVVSITFVSCGKDNVPEPPAPVNFSTLPFQYEYNGTEQHVRTQAGFLLEDTTYNRTYNFFAMAPDSNFRYVKFYTGVIDTLAIPLYSFAAGHGYYSKSTSDVAYPEYGADINHYAASFEFNRINDSIYFHLFDFKGNYWAYHYYFSGVRQ